VVALPPIFISALSEFSTSLQTVDLSSHSASVLQIYTLVSEHLSSRYCTQNDFFHLLNAFSAFSFQMDEQLLSDLLDEVCARDADCILQRATDRESEKQTLVFNSLYRFCQVPSERIVKSILLRITVERVRTELKVYPDTAFDAKVTFLSACTCHFPLSDDEYRNCMNSFLIAFSRNCTHAGIAAAVIGIYWILHYCRTEREIPPSFFSYHVWRLIAKRMSDDPLVAEYALYVARELAEKCHDQLTPIDVAEIVNCTLTGAPSVQMAGAFALAGIAATRPQLMAKCDMPGLVRALHIAADEVPFFVRPWIHNAMAVLLRQLGPDAALESAFGGVIRAIVQFPLDTALVTGERVEYDGLVGFVVELWQAAVARGMAARFWDAFGEAGWFEIVADLVERPQSEFGATFEKLRNFVEAMKERPIE
jgi:hypothetical protein